MDQRKPDALDIAVGRRIRIERVARRVSQTELAEQIGISFQQLQKYERGLNRIGAGRLARIAAVLGIPISALIAPDLTPVQRTRRSGGATGSLLAMLAEPGAVRALRAFTAISPSLRTAVLSLLEKLAPRRAAGAGPVRRRPKP